MLPYQSTFLNSSKRLVIFTFLLVWLLKKQALLFIILFDVLQTKILHWHFLFEFCLLFTQEVVQMRTAKKKCQNIAVELLLQ